jgi:hypothetical protein
MSVWNSPSEWQKYLESKYDSEESLEGHIRELGKTYLRNWRSAELFPVIGYDEELMDEPKLIGVAMYGTPRKQDGLYLFGIEDDLPDTLIDWVDTVMDLGDGLDCICEIMLNYHKATILVNLNNTQDMKTLFQDIKMGTRSTNYLKMKPGLKVSDKSSGVLLKTNSVLQTNFFTKDFRREWI